VAYCPPDDHDWFNLDVATLAFRIRERLANNSIALEHQLGLAVHNTLCNVTQPCALS